MEVRGSIPPPPAKNMKFKIDPVLGYKYCYAPKHPLANKSGKIYEHVYIMSKFIGRPLYDNECVHHIDRNRSNNSIDNLRLMTKEDHVKLHLLEDKGISYIERQCLFCSKNMIITLSSKQKFCNSECCNYFRRKFEIDREMLKKLVWEMPTVEVAKIFGVTDSANSKRCRNLNIDKPPRGYWTRLYFKTSEK